MIRYVFVVRDLHPLLLAGFTGALTFVVQVISTYLCVRIH